MTSNSALAVIAVKRLEYCHLPHDPTLEAACIAPYHSCYYAELEFQNRGPDTTVKEIGLTIDNSLEIPADRFNPIKLKQGEYHSQAFSFPVKEHKAVKQGAFEILSIDSSGKRYSTAGKFPIEP